MKQIPDVEHCRTILLQGRSIEHGLCITPVGRFAESAQRKDGDPFTILHPRRLVGFDSF